MSMIPHTELLRDVTQTTKDLLHILEQEFARASAPDLRKAPAPDKWNALQCFEHLNRYGHFYFPEFEKAIQKLQSEGKQARQTFKPGWLGNYAVNSMLLDPQTKQPRTKMPAFKNYNPSAETVSESTVQEMIRQQKHLLDIFKQAENISLDYRIPTTLSPFIKLKLGDVFRFLVAHNVRHTIQAQRALRS
jgi:hypothetical protein